MQKQAKRKMTMAKYKKKPVIIDAIQWTGENREEIRQFANNCVECLGNIVFIDTLEGTMQASVGDYIIRGVQGEYYPCKPDIFEETYEECELPYE